MDMAWKQMALWIGLRIIERRVSKRAFRVGVPFVGVTNQKAKGWVHLVGHYLELVDF